jgi:hypothetical protein
MVAKAEGKTATKANRRVAARIIKASNESVGERVDGAVETAGEKKRQMRDERRRGKEATSGDGPFYMRPPLNHNKFKPGTTEISPIIRLRRTPSD